MVEAWSIISPVEGLVVVGVYTAAALILAAWLVRRRDV